MVLAETRAARVGNKDEVGEEMGRAVEAGVSDVFSLFSGSYGQLDRSPRGPRRDVGERAKGDWARGGVRLEGGEALGTRSRRQVQRNDIGAGNERGPALGRATGHNAVACVCLCARVGKGRGMERRDWLLYRHRTQLEAAEAGGSGGSEPGSGRNEENRERQKDWGKTGDEDGLWRHVLCSPASGEAEKDNVGSISHCRGRRAPCGEATSLAMTATETMQGG